MGICADAIVKLRERGWCQGQFREGSTGAICLNTSLLPAEEMPTSGWAKFDGVRPAQQAVAQAARELFPDRIGSAAMSGESLTMALCGFNNNNENTIDDICAVLARADELMEAEEVPA